jgi:hypothetical protein
MKLSPSNFMSNITLWGGVGGGGMGVGRVVTLTRLLSSSSSCI